MYEKEKDHLESIKREELEFVKRRIESLNRWFEQRAHTPSGQRIKDRVYEEKLHELKRQERHIYNMYHVDPKEFKEFLDEKYPKQSSWFTRLRKWWRNRKLDSYQPKNKNHKYRR